MVYIKNQTNYKKKCLQTTEYKQWTGCDLSCVGPHKLGTLLTTRKVAISGTYHQPCGV